MPPPRRAVTPPTERVPPLMKVVPPTSEIVPQSENGVHQHPRFKGIRGRRLEEEPVDSTESTVQPAARECILHIS